MLWRVSVPRIRAACIMVTAAVLMVAVISLAVGGPSAAAAAPGPQNPLLSAGGNDTCAVFSGTVYCWGQTSPEADDDTYDPVPTAVHSSLLTGKSLIQVSLGGGGDACVLDTAGGVYCWEMDPGDQVPVAVNTGGPLAGHTLTQISGGGSGLCGLDEAGAAYCWSGVLASPPTAVDTSGVLAGKTLTQISVSTETCALDTAGAAYCWGPESLGDGASGGSAAPVAVDTSGALAGHTLTQISAGAGYVCALDSAGAAFCWGDDTGGELGDGQLIDTDQVSGSDVPVAVDTSTGLAGHRLVSLAASQFACTGECDRPNYGHTCAVDASGEGFCWGYDYAGSLGNGADDPTSAPVAVNTSGALAGQTLTQVATDLRHSCAMDSTGGVYCWGSDSNHTGSSVPEGQGPSAPVNVTLQAGQTGLTAAWQPPADLDGGGILSYRATAVPGGASCTTAKALSCRISGLASNTAYTVRVTVHTTAGDSSGSTPVSVTVGGGVSLTSAPTATAVAGTPFTFTVTATGTPAPSIKRTGALPKGLHLADQHNGQAIISGTPAARDGGPYAFTLTAKNRSGSATELFTLTVNSAPRLQPGPGTYTFSSSSFAVPLAATGYPAPVFSVTSTPAGAISFTDHGDGTAVLTGAPGGGGKYRVTVTATNSFGSSSRIITVKVLEAPQFTSADSVSATAGTPVSFQVTTDGYPAPRFTLAGDMPPGVRFRSSTGAFSGTPAAAAGGAYPVTITAANSAGTATQHLVIHIS
jgi:alpha-tubulin suppressor-like RCC1 family protein